MGGDHVLFVGHDRRLGPALRAVRNGTSTSVLCRTDHLPRVVAPEGHAYVVGVGPLATDEDWVRAARFIDNGKSITRVVSFEDRDQPRLPTIGAALGLPALSPDVIRVTTDKLFMRQQLLGTKFGLRGFQKVETPLDIVEFMREGYEPCVVKPISGEGSAGVTILSRHDPVDAAFTLANIAAASLGTSGVMVEEYIQGIKFSVEAFSEFRQHVVVGMFSGFFDTDTGVALGHVTPPLAEVEDQALLADYVIELLSTLEITDGPTHTEVILNADGPHLIETHLRMAGDDKPAMIRDAYGVDLADMTVRQALGVQVLNPLLAKVPIWEKPSQAAAIWFATSTSSGPLLGIEGFAAARTSPDVVEVQRLVLNGAPCGPCRSGEDRLASARSKGTTPGKAVQAARSAIEKLSFRTRSASVTGEGPLT